MNKKSPRDVLKLLLSTFLILAIFYGVITFLPYALTNSPLNYLSSQQFIIVVVVISLSVIGINYTNKHSKTIGTWKCECGHLAVGEICAHCGKLFGGDAKNGEKISDRDSENNP